MLDNNKEKRLALGNRVRKLRTDLDMTQEQLAFKLGYKTKSSINKIENGERNLTTEMMMKIAAVLNTTPQHLLGWEDKDLRSQIVNISSEMSSSQLKQLLDYAEFLLRKSGED